MDDLIGNVTDATIEEYVGSPAAVVVFGIAKDRKSTRLNSSHLVISYAVFCLKKKKTAPESVACYVFHAPNVTSTTPHRSTDREPGGRQSSRAAQSVAHTRTVPLPLCESPKEW